jgi:hypothetical protein
MKGLLFLIYKDLSSCAEVYAILNKMLAFHPSHKYNNSGWLRLGEIWCWLANGWMMFSGRWQLSYDLIRKSLPRKHSSSWGCNNMKLKGVAA